MASYDLALSMNTQYIETFDDPLIRPLNPQALSRSETKRFQKVTDPDRPQAKLPRKMRDQDPIVPILENSPAPARTPKKGRP